MTAGSDTNHSPAVEQRVLVAGAGSGIGRAVACAFAREGARLVLAGRSAGGLEETRSLCPDATAVVIEPIDISQPEQVQRLIDSACEALGGVDVLVNSAGTHGAIGPAHECDPAEWHRAFEVNVFGSFLLSRAVVPGMLAAGSGCIILFSGGGATAPLPRFSAYGASKAAVVRLAETLAEELRPTIQVHAIAPGLVDTKLLDNVIAASELAGTEFDQVQRMRAGETEAVPAELVARLAVFLARKASPDLTGRLISAPHDPWADWVGETVPPPGLYTLRRLDAHTAAPLLEVLR